MRVDPVPEAERGVAAPDERAHLRAERRPQAEIDGRVRIAKAPQRGGQRGARQGADQGQRLAGPRTADLDRPDEGMSGVQLAFQAVGIHLVLRRAPAGVEAGERDRVSRLDRQDRLEVAREVAVERAPLERDLAQRH